MGFCLRFIFLFYFFLFFFFNFSKIKRVQSMVIRQRKGERGKALLGQILGIYRSDRRFAQSWEFVVIVCLFVFLWFGLVPMVWFIPT